MLAQMPFHYAPQPNCRFNSDAKHVGDLWTLQPNGVSVNLNYQAPAIWPNWAVKRTPTLAMPLAFSWPVLVPSALSGSGAAYLGRYIRMHTARDTYED